MAKPRSVLWHLSQGLGYVAIRLAMTALQIAGWKRSQWAGRALGRILGAILPRRRELARANLLAAGMAADAGAADRLVDGMFESLGATAAEFFLLECIGRRRQVSAVTSPAHEERMEEALSRGRGVILSIGHLGNWELAGMYFCDRFQTLNSVYRPLDYPPLDRLVLRIRNAAGMTMVPRDRALPHVIRVLKRKGVAALLTDQDAKGDGVFVDFFGRPASTLPTPAALSTRFGTPIVPVNIYREGARLRIEFDPPIWPEAYAAEADPQRAITQEVVKRLEGFIRLHPEQWFWLHRRWKTQPPGA